MKSSERTDPPPSMPEVIRQFLAEQSHAVSQQMKPRILMRFLDALRILLNSRLSQIPRDLHESGDLPSVLWIVRWYSDLDTFTLRPHGQVIAGWHTNGATILQSLYGPPDEHAQSVDLGEPPKGFEFNFVMLGNTGACVVE